MKTLILKIIFKLLAGYAKKVLSLHNPVVIGVTGSVGKTSTKEAIYTVLRDEYKADVRKNHGNLNTEIGVPLTILGYNKIPNKFLWPAFLVSAYFRSNQKKYPKFLVLELSVDKKGDMKYLTDIVKLDHAIITSVSGAHLVNFSSEKEYQAEKLKIVDGLKDGGSVFINGDDKVLRENQKDDFLTFAVNNSADYRAEDIKLSLFGTEFRIVCTGYKVAVKSKLLGKHLIYGQLAAFALGDNLGISRLKIGKSLEKIDPIPGRMNLVEGKNNSIIIDDTYNACNTASVKAAIDLISEIKHKKGRKVLILGNMNELGNNEKVSHQEIGLYAKDKCDLAIFCGPNAEIMAKSFGDEKKSFTFKTRDELVSSLPDLLKEKDLILIKASQNGNYFEEVTKTWLRYPERADELLVRQNKFWKRKKGV